MNYHSLFSLYIIKQQHGKIPSELEELYFMIS